MWKLLIESDEGEQTEVTLGSFACTIGRGAGNFLRLTDRNVSREHAVIRRLGASYEIEDLESFNGTHLNGHPVVAARLLAPGDIIQIGDYALVFAHAAPNAAPPLALPRLVALDNGEELPLARDVVIIGRGEDVDVPLLRSSISRKHCRLTRVAGDRFEVVDLGSSNGIAINGVALRHGYIAPGDTLRIGDVSLRYLTSPR